MVLHICQPIVLQYPASLLHFTQIFKFTKNSSFKKEFRCVRMMWKFNIVCKMIQHYTSMRIVYIWCKSCESWCNEGFNINDYRFMIIIINTSQFVSKISYFCILLLLSSATTALQISRHFKLLNFITAFMLFTNGLIVLIYLINFLLFYWQ